MMGKISLDEFAGGAMKKQFNEAFTEVLDNLLDPNTSVKEKRTITITVTLATTEYRDTAAAKVETRTKLAKRVPGTQLIDIGRFPDGTMYAKEFGNMPGQQRFDADTGEIYEEDPADEVYQVTPIKKAEAEA